MERSQKTKNLVYTATLLAILLLLYFTQIGFLQIGPFAITTLHIPVIVTSIVLGWKRGALMGAIFGLLSLYRATVTITPTSFVFSPFVPVTGSEHGSPWAVVIALVPRILIGITPALVVFLFKKTALKRTVGYALAGLVGSLTNTILVLGLMGTIFGPQLGYHSLKAVFILIGTVIASNGIVEAGVATLITFSLANVFIMVEKRLFTGVSH